NATVVIGTSLDPDMNDELRVTVVATGIGMDKRPEITLVTNKHALVLLYPAGIDMYLVGLPRIAADLNASEAQLHIAFSVYLAGM
ncbi:hypothetical protein MJI20_29625, partial [Salmonella enterica subsp. enterica serovar Anatum]|nr:hypothetical protein [Salmonella enterica subsp. enterica serovar Anatum]